MDLLGTGLYLLKGYLRRPGGDVMVEKKNGWEKQKVIGEYIFEGFCVPSQRCFELSRKYVLRSLTNCSAGTSLHT